ncbi:hypothetical protein LCGC14_1561340 [marine sediment metagenome]|uniref:Uncharacterized protein n=1 Tax=marine sediment metagenome TaxID=412755 RepID=A0A0F9IME4_9ZZZZ
MIMKDVDIGMECSCMTEDTKTALLRILDYAKRQDEAALKKVEEKTITSPAITRESYLRALNDDIRIIDLVRSEIKAVKVCPRE